MVEALLNWFEELNSIRYVLYGCSINGGTPNHPVEWDKLWSWSTIGLTIPSAPNTFWEGVNRPQVQQLQIQSQSRCVELQGYE